MARPRRPDPVANGGIFLPDTGDIRTGSLTAAGVRMNEQRAQKYQRLSQPWQAESFAFYESSGECWYAAQFYARAISKLRLYAATVDENGEMKEIDDLNDPAVQALDRIKDSSGGRGQLLGSWARLMFLTGETYLTVTQEDDEERWEALSSDELRVSPGAGFVRLAAPSIEPEQLYYAPDDAFEPLAKGRKQAVVYRLWRRHPRYSLIADSPMRATIPLFQELELLQLAVRARARSRLNGAGILAVPTEILFANVPTGAEQDQSKSPVMEMLHKAATASIQNPGSAAAVVPIVIQGPAEALKELRWISPPNGQEKYEETGLRTELISRIAIGLDFPKEQLLGLGDANHWTAWLVDDQTWSAHLQPMANLLVEDLTGVYLRPYLKAQKVENFADYLIWYDAAEVINHPDRNKDAQQMYLNGELSGRTWRDVAGFNDQNDMSDEEFRIYLARTFNDPQMLPEKYRPEQPKAPEPQPQQLQDQPDQTPGEGPPTEPDRQQVEQQAQQDSSANGNAANEPVTAAAAELAGVARATVRRARELAGSRMRTRARKTPLEELAAGCTASAGVPHAIGPERCAEANLGSPHELVASAGDGFVDIAAEFGMEASVGRRIATLLEEHAARTLFEENPEPLPPTLRAYLERVL